jgi:hypothetical protein
VDFTDLEGNVTALGRFLAEEFSISLAESAKGFEVIDRIHLASLLREHKLSSTGLLSRLTSRKLGDIVPVDVIVTGSLTPFGGDEVRVSIKILDVSTARMIGAKQSSITQSATIKDLLAKGIAAAEVTSQQSRPASAPAEKAEEPEAAPEDVATTKVQDHDGFVFQVQGCQVSGQSVECHLMIENRGSDRILEIEGKSRIFDENNNEYYPAIGRIANSNETFHYRNSTISKTLINGVPVQIGLRFEGVSPSPSAIASLSLAGSSGNRDFHLSFRNVPLKVRKLGGIASQAAGAAGLEDASQSPGGLMDGFKGMLKEEALEGARKGLKKLLGGSDKDKKDDGENDG